MLRFGVLLFVSLTISSIDGHGRLMKPPNRSSIWRIADFAHLNPPPNYMDNELFCGGIHQSEVVGGNCGVCGDPFSQASPRANEIGGEWYRGIKTGIYNSGQDIDVEVDITADHMGYMEFRLCDLSSGGETQDCFNRNLLQRADGGGSKVDVNRGSGIYTARLRLPSGLRCNHCVLQWNYRTGNAWGQCNDGTTGVGCGAQETFRGCSDVEIK